ncbi:MAG: hypothetical protein PHT83_04660 [Bacilli bacterium]|nr:hypothetical protein [Bacilli bacterium]
MKKIFTLFMLVLLAFILVGCDKDDPIIEAPTTYASATLEFAVFELIENYRTADNYGVKLTSDDGETTLVTEIKMNKTGTAINSMAYTQTGGESDMHVYISENMAYMLTVDGDKIKYSAGATEQAAILSSYGFAKFIEDVEALLLDDAALYAALPASVDVTNNVATFALDLLTYSGTYFTEADSANLKITFTGTAISAIEIEVTKASVVMSNKVEFLGTTAQTVTLPADAASYVAQ